MNRSFHTIDSKQCPIAQEELAEWIFQGEMVVFSQLPSIWKLVNLAREVTNRYLESDDPQTAETAIGPKQFKQRCSEAQLYFQHLPEAQSAFLDIMIEIGSDPQHLYLDKMGLRIFPSQTSHLGPRLAGTHVHRDSWGSNIYQQINWWMPIYPLHRDNTLVIYPDYWRNPVENNSSEWRYESYKKQRLETAGLKKINYAAAPIAAADTRYDNEIRVLIEPGDLLCFSSAHLHGGLPNTSGLTRISFETRTVHEDDIIQDRKAPNVDGEYPLQHPKWFKHAVHGHSLALPSEKSN